MGFALLRAVKTDVISIVVIYNVLSHHAEILTPPKLTPDSEAICPVTERLSRTTGQWDGSCLTQCFPQPTLFARNTQSEVQRKGQIFVYTDDIISRITIQHTPSCWVIHYKHVTYPQRLGDEIRATIELSDLLASSVHIVIFTVSFMQRSVFIYNMFWYDKTEMASDDKLMSQNVNRTHSCDTLKLQFISV